VELHQELTGSACKPSAMYTPYFFAQVEVPRLDADQLARFKREGIVPTYVRDSKPVPDEPAHVCVRIDAATETEAGVRLVHATSSKARVLHPRMAQDWLPVDMAGLTPVGCAVENAACRPDQ
jgi:hypothetical protein